MKPSKRFTQWVSLVGVATSCLAACQAPMSGNSSDASASVAATPSASSAATTDTDLLTGTFQDIKGQTYRLEDLRGKKVYIKFWASWCSICLAGLQEVDQLAQDPGSDVVILSMVAPEIRNEKPLADFRQWFTSLDYTHLPVLVDEGGALMKQLGVVAYPSSAFIDSTGHLVKVQTGHLDRQAIQDQLASMP